jgi:hypothetical protein
MVSEQVQTVNQKKKLNTNQTNTGKNEEELA